MLVTGVAVERGGEGDTRQAEHVPQRRRDVGEVAVDLYSQARVECVRDQVRQVRVEGGFPADELDGAHADARRVIDDVAPVVGGHGARGAVRAAGVVAVAALELAFARDL